MTCSWCQETLDNESTGFCSTECAFRMHNLLSTRIKTLKAANRKADKELLATYREELEKINMNYKGVFCKCQE